MAKRKKEKVGRKKKIGEAEKVGKVGKVEKVGIGELIALPVVALLILSALNSVFREVPIFWALVLVLAVFVYGYVGWSAVKKCRFGLLWSALAGAAASVVADLIYLVVLLVLGINILVDYGVDLTAYEIPSEAIPTFTAIVVIVSIIFSAIIAAVVALIGAAVAQRVR